MYCPECTNYRAAVQQLKRYMKVIFCQMLLKTNKGGKVKQWKKPKPILLRKISTKYGSTGIKSYWYGLEI